MAFYNSNNNNNLITSRALLHSLINSAWQLKKKTAVKFKFVKLITCTWILLVTCLIVQMTGFNRPAKFLILLKHWGYNNFELNWFHALSKIRAIPFSQVSADSFHFNIQKCSRSLYAFIAFRPTCFAWHLVMRNLHKTSTQHAR